MPTETEKKTELKYLFIARFTDGTTFEQTSDDKSRNEATKSAYTDLLGLVSSGRKLESFFLVEQGKPATEAAIVAVDLREGFFVVNGNAFWASERQIPVGTELRLIYKRRNWRVFQYGGQEVGVGPEVAHIIRYFVGWEATIDGQTVQAVIGVD